VLRVWLPDRPGALGVLAAEIGANAAEIVGIDILERAGGYAVDELTVEVAEPDALEPLVRAIQGLDGFDIEDVRPLVSRLPYSVGDPLEAAIGLVACASVEELLSSLAHSACAVFSCDWASVVDLGSSTPVAIITAGPAPAPAWLDAFVRGARSSGTPEGALAGPRDIAWAELDAAGVVAVIGRDGPPFRSRERRELAQLGRVADTRWRDLIVRVGMEAHPSAQSRRRHPATAS
jgi:hypothetical protein